MEGWGFFVCFLLFCILKVDAFRILKETDDFLFFSYHLEHENTETAELPVWVSVADCTLDMYFMYKTHRRYLHNTVADLLHTEYYSFSLKEDWTHTCIVS